ncbi:UNKNOWN [Stylonychia lemnae]|uniref:Casein kinase I n=1 Tax=Stylonychia lemnae TaxID=5949 RepID=A0A078B1U1_STYLE|nr:UNKNOWN [Stylonychia lemnae]|eukprot:CDW87272.1 UNKNOWN [Stylonychia lemnae]
MIIGKQPQQKIDSTVNINNNFNPEADYIIKSKYILKNYIKGGGFGDIFVAKHIEKGYEVAIKFVMIPFIFIFKQSELNNDEATRQYENEVDAMKTIKRIAGVRASLFPKLLANGYLSDKKLNYIIMPKYDIDLERLFMQYKRKFKMETVITLGLQIIERLEIMHNCGLIHNDLKPQNIMTNFKSNTVFLIDFGLTLNQNQAQKIAYTFKGTPYFASNNQLVKGKLGAKDDLESLVYILIYFIQGYLPWAKNVPVLSEDMQAHLEVQQVIHQRDPDTLCTDLDPEFNSMLSYIQSCSAKQKPDYRYIKKQLQTIKDRNNFLGQLEWIHSPDPSTPMINPLNNQLIGSGNNINNQLFNLQNVQMNSIEIRSGNNTSSIANSISNKDQHKKNPQNLQIEIGKLSSQNIHQKRMTINTQNKNNVIMEESEYNSGGLKSNRHVEPHSAQQLTRRKKQLQGGQNNQAELKHQDSARGQKKKLVIKKKKGSLTRIKLEEGGLDPLQAQFLNIQRANSNVQQQQINRRKKIKIDSDQIFEALDGNNSLDDINQDDFEEIFKTMIPVQFECNQNNLKFVSSKNKKLEKRLKSVS